MQFFRMLKMLLLGQDSESIGKDGERIVQSIIRHHFGAESYRLLNDVNIPRNDTSNQNITCKKTQIDHILISVYGIFVIETKHYSGWIFGNKNQKKWAGVYYGSKYHFQNPIKQNRCHIYALSELLKIPKNKFHNIVCFTGNAVFKTPLPSECYLKQTFIEYIKRHQNKLFTTEQVTSMYNRICLENETDNGKWHF